MKKSRKLLKFDFDLESNFGFSDMVIPKVEKNNIIPVKKVAVIDNKNKNKDKNVGIF